MENKLEQLLNSLIEKGWKPFGEDRITKINRCEQYAGHWNWGCWSEKSSYWRWKCTRQLVSKESGLWQFVCENGMIKKEGNSEWTIIYPNERAGDYQKCHSYCKGQSEYWILESALCDEDKLEDFILDNVKIDG